MRAKEFTEGIGGLEYEQNVANVLKQVLTQFQGHAKFVNLDCGTAGFCNVGIDLELDVNGKDFNIELKQSPKAQMGGTSVRYNPGTDMAEIVNAETIDEESKAFFISAAKSKKDDIIAFVDFLKQQPPAELHANMTYKFPVSGVTKEAWANAKDAGLLKTLNDKVRFTDSSIIANAYNKKKVYYIQIGGAGLFYLNQNPYQLPISKFDGEIDIEFRLGRSGSIPRMVNGTEFRVVAATYRCQGRLITKIKSPLSLDNHKDASTIIQHIIDYNQKTNVAPDETPKITNGPSMKNTKAPSEIPASIQNQQTTLATSKIPMGQKSPPPQGV